MTVKRIREYIKNIVAGYVYIILTSKDCDNIFLLDHAKRFILYIVYKSVSPSRRLHMRDKESRAAVFYSLALHVATHQISIQIIQQ